MIDSPLKIVKSVIPDLTGCRILDVGCGDGRFAKLLAQDGPEVVGVDPHLEAVRQARISVPESQFIESGAQSLPFENSSFNIIVFINALHHVPVAMMLDALRESTRVLENNGFLIVVEPLAEGSFFEALRPVEDETEIRLHAQNAVEETIRAGVFQLKDLITFTRREVFDDVDQFLQRVVAVDPARQAAADQRRDDVIAALDRFSIRTADSQIALDQPLKAHVLKK